MLWLWVTLQRDPTGVGEKSSFAITHLLSYACGTGQFVPPERVHANLFKNSDRMFQKPSQPAVKRYNKVRSLVEKAKMAKRLRRKENCLRKRLAEKGIKYSFPGFVSLGWF